MGYDNSGDAELDAKSMCKEKYIYISHNQLEQIRCPRQGVVDRILLDLKAKENNGVQAIWKRKKTKYN